MAIQINPNQPIVFNQEVETCFDQPDFAQLVNQTDVTQIQVEISPCVGTPQLVQESSFATVQNWNFASWTWERGTICHVAGSPASADQGGVFVSGNIYQVSIIVESIFGQLSIYNGTTLIGIVDSTGETIFTFTAVNENISIQITDSTSSACVNSITAYEISNDFLVAIRVNETGAIAHLFTIASQPTRFVFAKNTITISIPWADLGLPNGCYFISIDDLCTNTCGQLGIPNASESYLQNVPSSVTLEDSGWTVSGTATATIDTTNKTIKITGAIGTSVTLTNNLFSTCAKTYQICHSVSISNANVQYTIGDVSSSVVSSSTTSCLPSLTPTTNGEFSVQITNSGAGAMNVEFSYITLELVNTDYEFAYDSCPINLGTFNCSLLVNISNDNDAFGFVFVGSGFAPRMRVHGTLRNAKYPAERKTIETANGQKSLYYSRQRKTKELVTEPMPEYALDFVSLLPVMNHAFIDGTEYSVEDDEPNITYPNGTQDYGNIIMLVSEKQQVRENRHVGNPINPISAVDGFIVNPQNRIEILTEPSTGDTVKAL